MGDQRIAVVRDDPQRPIGRENEGVHDRDAPCGTSLSHVGGIAGGPPRRNVAPQERRPAGAAAGPSRRSHGDAIGRCLVIALLVEKFAHLCRPHVKQPNSDRTVMNDTIENLRLEIRITDDPAEKHALMTELVRTLYTRAEYQGALTAAREALAFAESIDDTRYRAGALRMVGTLLGALSNYAEALRVDMRALKLFRTLGDREGEATMLLNLGISNYQVGNYPKALELLHESRELVQALGRADLAANVLMTEARVHATLGATGDALAGLLEALAIVEATPGTDLLSALLVNIGCTYSDAGEHDDAERFWLRGIEAARTAGDREVERRALVDLAGLHRMRDQHREALALLDDALTIARAMEDDGAVTLALGEIGLTHRMLGEHEKALADLNNALESARGRGDRINELLQMWYIGGTMIEMGRRREGVEMLEAALALCAELGAKARQWEIHRDLAAAYDAAGDIGRAYHHYRQHAEIKEEVMGKQQQRTISNLTTRHEIETAHKERDILRLENGKLQMEIEHKRGELTSLALHLVQKNEVLEKLRDEVVRMVNAATGDAKGALRRLVPVIQQSIGTEQEWGAFEQRFVEVHPGFVEALIERAPDLSPTELRVASLLRIQMNTKDIAMLMSVTTRAVEKHRLQLRKKLGLEGSVGLHAYLAAISHAPD